MRMMARLQSIRLRLILIPLLVLPAMLGCAIAILLAGSDQRIAAETQSGMKTGRLLIDYALRSLDAAPDAGFAARRLIGDLATVRHVQFFYLATENTGQNPPLLHAEAPRAAVPEWFAGLFHADRPVETYPVIFDGVQRGEIILVGNPLDEIGEVWSELMFLVGLLAGASLLILLSLLWTVRLVVGPMNALSDGLDRLGRGLFDGIGRSSVSELRSIGEKFNILARSLEQARIDNRLLIDKLILVQESERRELARELHDDFGATLFSIRAELACILDAAGRGGVHAGDVCQHAGSMSEMIDDIQKKNYRMLERLRPASLSHVRLSETIGDLVDAWAERHRGICWLLTIEEDIDATSEDASLTIYRMVQECLVNAVRHARAGTVEIALSYQAGPGQSILGSGNGERCILISICDDGAGLPPDFRMGFGLLGMSERVRRLGGRLSIANGRDAGVVIEAIIPCAFPAAGIRPDPTADGVLRYA